MSENEYPKFKEFPLPPWVERIPGEALRFHVRSRTDPEVTYLVDLEECGFNGACGCPQFSIRLLKALRTDRRLGKRRKHRCWHIKQALYYMSELTVRLVAKEINGRNLPQHRNLPPDQHPG